MAGIIVLYLIIMTYGSVKAQAWLDVYRNLEIIGLVIYFVYKTPTIATISTVLYVFIAIHFTGMLVYGLIKQDQVSILSSAVILTGVGIYMLIIRRLKKK